MIRKILAASAATLFLLITSLTMGAGRSDVADAAMKGDKAAIRSLILQKSDVNAPQVDGATALHWAVYKDDLEMLDLLIKAGARVNAANREGDLESAKLLLDKGAKVDQATEYGWTPLLRTTNNRHYTVAEYLVERGANPNIADKGNWTPLYLATDNCNIEGGDFPVPK